MLLQYLRDVSLGHVINEGDGILALVDPGTDPVILFQSLFHQFLAGDLDGAFDIEVGQFVLPRGIKPMQTQNLCRRAAARTNRVLDEMLSGWRAEHKLT